LSEAAPNKHLILKRIIVNNFFILSKVKGFFNHTIDFFNRIVCIAGNFNQKGFQVMWRNVNNRNVADRASLYVFNGVLIPGKALLLELIKP
jgi:hypothetical protein